MALEGRDWRREARCVSSLVLVPSSVSFVLVCTLNAVESARGSTRGGTRVKGGMASKGTSKPALAVHFRICRYNVLESTFWFLRDAADADADADEVCFASAFALGDDVKCRRVDSDR